MKVQGYPDIQAALLGGHIDVCHDFLRSRREADQGSVDYWYWLAQTCYRSGRFVEAVNICFKLTREAGSFTQHLYSLADICAHWGARSLGLAGIDLRARRPEMAGAAACTIQLYGYHGLGEDGAVLGVPRQEGAGLSSTDHLRARSLMRSQGIAAGVEAFHESYSSPTAVAALWPDQTLPTYWHGQRTLPKQLKVLGFACGYGDYVQWLRYARALRALGVEVEGDAVFAPLVADAALTEQDHHFAAVLRLHGYALAGDDAIMWTSPFALFSALFPVLGYAAGPRYIEPRADSRVTDTVKELRQRAQGRRCAGVFWSSCESNNLYASRSLHCQQLAPLWAATDDIHWVVMQRGFERLQWLDGPYAQDTGRFTTLPLDLSLAQTVGVIDQLDGFVGNDGVLSHVAGALGKPGLLMLNTGCADWRYERHEHTTPWYPSIRLVHPVAMGAWDTLVAQLPQALRATV